MRIFNLETGDRSQVTGNRSRGFFTRHLSLVTRYRIEPSAATRRDWRHVQLAFWEFVDDTRDHPFISLACLVTMLFFLIGPWVF